MNEAKPSFQYDEAYPFRSKGRFSLMLALLFGILALLFVWSFFKSPSLGEKIIAAGLFLFFAFLSVANAKERTLSLTRDAQDGLYLILHPHGEEKWIVLSKGERHEGLLKNIHLYIHHDRGAGLHIASHRLLDKSTNHYHEISREAWFRLKGLEG